jgi:hypothetical protein
MPSLSDNDCLIGYSGFVGSTLLKQKGFKALYRSTNIGDIEGRSFDTVVCAGAPAQKWIANRDPEADREKISGLMARLETIRCRNFVLVSTVDVFKEPVGVDEGTPVDRSGLHPYGLNRLRLEEFVAGRFPRSLIVRLPGLIGPGLRKNVLFDFLNGNNLHAIDSRGIYQFYPTVNLWYDIRTALDARLELLHLTAEPLSVAEAAAQGFGISFQQCVGQTPAVYDMRTRHGKLFGAAGDYQYTRRETLQAIRAYAQSEPRTLKALEETAA